MSPHRSLITLVIVGSLLGGCAALESRPAPLTREAIVLLARSGETPIAIIERIRQTDTVLALSASDILQLSEAGVPREVLDYMQTAQMQELRRRLQFYGMLYGPEISPFSRCGSFGPATFNCYGYPYWLRY
jgi:hypothetical protein